MVSQAGLFFFCRNIPKSVGSFLTVTLVIIFIILIQMEGFKYILNQSKHESKHQSQESFSSYDVRQEHYFAQKFEQEQVVSVKR